MFPFSSPALDGRREDCECFKTDITRSSLASFNDMLESAPWVSLFLALPVSCIHTAEASLLHHLYPVASSGRLLP